MTKSAGNACLRQRDGAAAHRRKASLTPDAGVVRSPTSQEAHPARRANTNLAVGVLEDGAAVGQLLHVRRVGVALAEGLELGAQIIHQHVQHILCAGRRLALGLEARVGRRADVARAGAAVDLGRDAGDLLTLQVAAAAGERAGRRGRQAFAEGLRRRLRAARNAERADVLHQAGRALARARLPRLAAARGERGAAGGAGAAVRPRPVGAAALEEGVERAGRLALTLGAARGRVGRRDRHARQVALRRVRARHARLLRGGEAGGARQRGGGEAHCCRGSARSSSSVGDAVGTRRSLACSPARLARSPACLRWGRSRLAAFATTFVRYLAAPQSPPGPRGHELAASIELTGGHSRRV